MTRKQRKLYKQAVHVRFEDECRAIGSGIRPVVIKTLGPKWASLISPYTGKTHKLPRRVWDHIAKASGVSA